jgi:hypothetical protein
VQILFRHSEVTEDAGTTEDKEDLEAEWYEEYRRYRVYRGYRGGGYRAYSG